ncbi:MAG: MATE family efflux transporter [Acetobacterium sp.]|nr:MATE family efflux transporter [Bacillota bacterium]MCG2729189.1 MATE family efflux transporter [Acetobacterium sp.]
MNNTATIETKENTLGTDPIGKLMVKFAVPSIIAMVVNALYNIVDQIFIGRGVGFLGNGATNVVLPITILVIALALLIGDGGAAYMALQLGKGDKKAAAKGVGNVVTLAILLGIGFAIICMVFLEPLCLLLGATENILPYALDYGRIIIIGFPFSVISIALSGVIRADGNPKYSMMGMILGCITNVILNPIFIFVFHWGVQGSALATIIGQALNCGMYLLYIRKFKSIDIKRNYLKLKAGVITKVCSLGVSSFITQIAIVVVIAVSNNVLVKYGAMSVYGADIPLTTMGITMKVSQLSMAIVLGIATGAQPILGYNYGAGNMERTKKTFKITIIAATICMVAATIVFQFFPKALVDIFGTESELYTTFAIMCFRVFLLFSIFSAFQMCTGIFFQAIGKPVEATILSMSRQIIIFIPATLILPMFMGVEGVLWAGPVSDLLAFILAAILLTTQWNKIFHKKPIKEGISENILQNA